MEIIIKEILKETPEGVLIWFETEIGSAKAEWYGEKPEINSKYFVEFTIEDELIWGKNILKINEKNPLIDYKNDKLIFQGKVNLIYEDGVIVVLLTPSSFIMIDLKNANLVTLGDFVRIIASKVTVFDCRI